MPRRSPPPSTASTRSWSASQAKTRQRAPRSSSVRSAWNKPSVAQMRDLCRRQYRGLSAWQPPVPPLPWIRHDPSIERPFVADEVPLIGDRAKTRLENDYTPARKTKVDRARSGRAVLLLGRPLIPWRMRRGEISNCAARLPACPAWSSRLTTLSWCRCRGP